MTSTSIYMNTCNEDLYSESSDTELKRSIEFRLFNYMDYALSQGKSFEEDLIPGYDTLSAISFDLGIPKEKTFKFVQEILKNKPAFEFSHIEKGEIVTLLSSWNGETFPIYGTCYSMDNQLVKMFYFSRNIVTHARSTFASFVNENLSDFLSNNEEYLLLGQIPILKKYTTSNSILIARQIVEYDSTILVFNKENSNPNLQLNLMNRNKDFLNVFSFVLKDELSMSGLLKVDSNYSNHQIDTFKLSLKGFLCQIKNEDNYLLKPF